jgi:hypothetical protein
MKRDNFKIEPGYFEGLEGQIMSKIALDKSQPFALPENYFDGLDSKINKTVQTKSSKLIRISKLTGIAASFVLGIILLWPNSEKSADFDIASSIAYLNEEDFDSYSDALYSNIDLSEQLFDLNLDNIKEDEFYLTDDLIEEIYYE